MKNSLSSAQQLARHLARRIAPRALLVALVAHPSVMLAQISRNDTLPPWFLSDPSRTGVVGAGVSRAFSELLATRQPQRTVIVAIIDVGVDTTHPALVPHLWSNPREIPGNGIDDDRDGYVDDVRGWNFLGGRDGRNVERSTLEVTRLFARCASLPRGTDRAGAESFVLAPGLPDCATIQADYIRQRDRELRRVERRMSLLDSLERAITVLTPRLGADSLSVARVAVLSATTAEVAVAQAAVRRAAEQFGALRSVVTLSVATVTSMRQTVLRLSSLSAGLDTSLNERSIVGDRADTPHERGYGNPDVMGAGAAHGTHLAGIVRTVVGNGLAVKQARDSVRIMMIRATTDGDERDKDIANAIRFAVDHGAHIISMSFGKPYSPEKGVVDSAVRYADQMGALLIHSAGNDASDIDQTHSYPSSRYLNGERAGKWIEVGASNVEGNAQLAADFSNFGRESVDLFAPGVDMRASALGGGYERRSGTSQAAPVVAGAAALLMLYDRTLSGRDAKRILLASVAKFSTLIVRRPGGKPTDMTPFSRLSKSGGVVNVFNALQMLFAISGR